MENNTNFSNHGSESHNFHAKPFVVVNCALNALLMLVSILGNTLILAAIIRTPSIRSPSMIMLGSLAATDLLVGLIAHPLFITDELIMKNHVLYTLSAMIGFALCGISLTTITVISMDRFISNFNDFLSSCFVALLSVLLLSVLLLFVLYYYRWVCAKVIGKELSISDGKIDRCFQTRTRKAMYVTNSDQLN